MDFPSYVPEGARQHALHYLGYWEQSLAEYDNEIAELKLRIKQYNNSVHHEKLREIEKSRNELAEDVSTIKRLIHDVRMKDAYKLLVTAFFDEENPQTKIDSFIHGAWSARLDFSKYREALKKADDLRSDIAETADKLANLLDEIVNTSVYCPAEFSSIPALLSSTDNHNMNNHNLYMWRSMRKYILGDLPEREQSDIQIQYDKNEPIEFKIVFLEEGEKPIITPEEERRNTLRYAWGTSPYFSAMLKTVSTAAKEFEPSVDGFIGSAINSRKSNVSTEYVRAFGALLNDYKVPITTDIMKAIAITATVVINSPDIVVSPDDTRKALAQIS
jgi:hypothetical protein